MKKLEFETSKGRFVVVDKNSMDYLRAMCNYDLICKLSEMTEEQVSEILEEFHKNNFGTIKNPDYGFYDYNKNNFHLSSSIESLHSLIKSKGVHLFENPHPRRYIMAMTDKGIVDTTEKLYLESEQKTFYNPYIFKICTKQQS